MGWGKKLKLLWLGLLLVQYCNHTSHLFVYCKNLICSNERVRSEGGRQGGGGTIVHLFSAKVSALYQLTVKVFLQK